MYYYLEFNIYICLRDKNCIQNNLCIWRFFKDGLCNWNLNQHIQHYQHPESSIMTLSKSISILTSKIKSYSSLFCYIIMTSWEVHIKRTLQYMVLCVSESSSLSIMFLNFIHVFTCISSLFFLFMTNIPSYHYITVILFSCWQISWAISVLEKLWIKLLL